MNSQIERTIIIGDIIIKYDRGLRLTAGQVCITFAYPAPLYFVSEEF